MMMATGKYIEVFNKHYKHLILNLPMESLLPTFVSKGLLNCTHLHQKIKSNKTDTAKATSLLDSMKGGLQIGERSTFNTFLEALSEYAKETDDATVKKLVDDVYKDLPFENTRVLCDDVAGSKQENCEPTTEAMFAECQTLQQAFVLLTVKMKGLMLQADFRDIRRSCCDHFNSPGSGAKVSKKIAALIMKCSSLNDLFDVLSNKTKQYWNGFDIRILHTMAVASQQNEAKKAIVLYEKVIYPKKLSDILPDLFPCENTQENEKENIPFYTVITETMNKDVKSVTVGDIIKHRILLERKVGLENLFGLLGIFSGSLIIYWTIPTEMVYYVYQSVKKHSFLFDSISSLEIGDYPAIKFSSESVLPKEELTSWISNELPKYTPHANVGRSKDIIFNLQLEHQHLSGELAQLERVMQSLQDSPELLCGVDDGVNDGDAAVGLLEYSMKQPSSDRDIACQWSSDAMIKKLKGEQFSLAISPTRQVVKCKNDESNYDSVFDITSHVQCSPVLSDIDTSAVKNVPTTSSVLEGPSNIKFKKPRTNKPMKSGRDLVRRTYGADNRSTPVRKRKYAKPLRDMTNKVTTNFDFN